VSFTFFIIKKYHKNGIFDHYKYLFEFNPNDCDSIYFDELLKFLEKIKPEYEKYERTTTETINKLKLECSYNEITKM
jgi:hypothetical protein